MDLFSWPPHKYSELRWLWKAETAHKPRQTSFHQYIGQAHTQKVSLYKIEHGLYVEPRIRPQSSKKALMQKFVEFVRLLINWLVWIFRGTLRTPETIGPKRFENRWLTPLRGFSMLLLILIPAWLWLASLLSTTPEQTRSVLMPLCPSVRYVSLKQLYKQTTRYTGRKLWIAGRLVKGKQLCARQQCKKNTTCCHPCTSSLRLQDGVHSVKIKGFLRGKWLSCTGTTCGMSCTPLKVGRWLAFAGRLRRVDLTRKTNVGLSFYVTHACRTSRNIFKQHSSTIPNPEQLRHLQRQQSKIKKRR